MARIAGKRVVHLTSAHAPRDIRIFFKECRSLARAGYDVRLMAPGEKEELVDGVRIVPLRRPKGRLDRFTLSLGRIFAAALRERADVYHFHDPDLMLVGLALSLMGRCVIYDVHESYREAVLDKEWIPRPIRRIVSKAIGLFESVAAGAFDAVVTATPHIAELFPPQKTYVVHNFPILEEHSGHTADGFLNRASEFVYAGSISRERGALEMVAAVDKTLNPRIRLHLAGVISGRGLEAQLSALPGCSRVVTHGWLSRTDVLKLYGHVVAGLVVLQPLERYRHSMPIKLFEYMSAGLPFIASDFPAWRDIIDQYRCGIAVDPSRPDGIANAMDWIDGNREEASQMGARGREAVLTRFNWDIAEKQLLACYDKVLA